MDSERAEALHNLCSFLRRSQEIQEEAALESHLLLLDWEKAFDKVPQSKIIRATRRLGVPEKIINMIKAIYIAPNSVITEISRQHLEFRKPELDKDAHCHLTFLSC